MLAKIIERERPDALLPTLGGQTALNLAMELVEDGVLDRFGVELIGANAESIATAENRDQFKQAMIEIGLDVPASGVAAPPQHLRDAPKDEKAKAVLAAMEIAREVVEEIGLPVVIRPGLHPGRQGHGHRRAPPRSSSGWLATAWRPVRSPRSSSRRASRAGRSTSSR